MRTGRPKNPLEISEEECEKLTMIARRPKSSQAMAMRARIVLSCEKSSNSEVARQMNITGATVGKWRQRFIKSRLDGLLDEPRVGAPRRLLIQRGDARIQPRPQHFRWFTWVAKTSFVVALPEVRFTGIFG